MRAISLVPIWNNGNPQPRNPSRQSRARPPLIRHPLARQLVEQVTPTSRPRSGRTRAGWKASTRPRPPLPERLTSPRCAASSSSVAHGCAIRRTLPDIRVGKTFGSIRGGHLNELDQDQYAGIAIHELHHGRIAGQIRAPSAENPERPAAGTRDPAPSAREKATRAPARTRTEPPTIIPDTTRVSK